MDIIDNNVMAVFHLVSGVQILVLLNFKHRVLPNLEVLNHFQNVPDGLYFDAEILVNVSRLQIVILIVVRSERPKVGFK